MAIDYVSDVVRDAGPGVVKDIVNKMTSPTTQNYNEAKSNNSVHQKFYGDTSPYRKTAASASKHISKPVTKNDVDTQSALQDNSDLANKYFGGFSYGNPYEAAAAGITPLNFEQNVEQQTANYLPHFAAESPFAIPEVVFAGNKAFTVPSVQPVPQVVNPNIIP